MRLLFLILALAADLVPSGDAYLKQLQQRDSILIADQLEYGFEMKGVERGTQIALPDFSKASNDTLTLVRNWKVDTLSRKNSRTLDIRGTIVIAPFEEAEYELPDIYVLRMQGDKADTLLFKSRKIEVKSMPVDTSTFVLHDLKGQMTYPVTFVEVLPWLGIALAVIALAVLAVWLVKRKRASAREQERRDPPHIIALRELDRYRSDRFWAPEKQKQFYSGVTDALKNYIDARFCVDAPEMTTAELFTALKSEKDISPDLYLGMKDLFERADFVKFAKFVATDEDNAGTLPLAVRFVTSTYQAEIQEEAEGGAEAAGK